MGMGSPSIKSDAQITEEARIEEERVKFQGEKQSFIESVAKYELLATDARKAHEATFEYQAPGSWQPGGGNGSGLFIPAKFNPSFDDPGAPPSNNINTSQPGAVWSNQTWFHAPNLGIFNPYAARQANQGMRGYTPPPGWTSS